MATGKSTDGDVFLKMRQAKVEYKNAINKHRTESESKFSDELSEALMYKNKNNFWKSWNSKFRKKNKNNKMVGGYNNDDDIAQVFKEYFSHTCTPNNESVHNAYKDDFLKNFEKYSIYEERNDLFTIENIENAVYKLKKGKAAGSDNVTVEHLVYAHPCLFACIKILFNLMLTNGVVPDEFGKGLLIPLLKDSSGDAAQCDNYRGITLSCVVSKVFEYALLEKYSSLFMTDNLQFGFKNGVGCSDALFTVKSVVNHFVKNGCTVTITALDISKAFDRISHYALFSKLMSRKFPKQVISVFVSWYTKCFVKVKWNDKLSDSFQTTAGVRQGGVLSPLLFAIYIEEIIHVLKVQKKGCIVGRVYVGCFLYADDILLISQSLTCMQSMLNTCSKISEQLDLKFNVKKSAVLRIGRRYDLKCNSLLLDGQVVSFVDEIKYLGIYIRSGLAFNRSFCSSKIKFYRCFNAIYSKASFASEEVLINLFRCYCLPIITYACESVYPSKTDIKSLNKLITTVFYRIFHTFDSDVISVIRDFFDLSDIATILERSHNNFIAKYFRKNFTFSTVVYSIYCRSRCLLK